MDIIVSLASLLALTLAGFLLVVLLISTPWQILLVLLVIGLVGVWWLIQQNQLQRLSEVASAAEAPIASTMVHPEHSSAADSPLKYRGTCYSPGLESNSAPPSEPVLVTGKYRGSFWQKSPLTKRSAPEEQVPIAGKYRGCELKMFTTKPD